MRQAYIIKQLIGILMLVFFAFVADYYVKNIYINIQNLALQQLIMVVATSLVLLVCNQMVLNYAKENADKFMQHNIWDKMFIVILLFMVISFVVFLVLFFTTPLESFISSRQWLLFIVIYYFLFFMNLFTLSIVHKVVDRSMSYERKIVITWASATLFIALIVFVLPNF